MDYIHLVKLSVGTESVQDLENWQKTPYCQGPDGFPRHVTRMWPKKETEILAGGSIYWVIKGIIQCRQPILRLDEVIGDDGVHRCAIVLQPGLIPTTPAPKRAFQGWRYLNPQDAPPDLGTKRATDDDLPPALAGALADIGVL